MRNCQIDEGGDDSADDVFDSVRHVLAKGFSWGRRNDKNGSKQDRMETFCLSLNFYY